ncbi:MAG: hypothetical protein R3C68_17650 [Myxococcota bacterium]
MNILKETSGGQFQGRYGNTDTKTPFPQNMDADRPRTFTREDGSLEKATGMKQSAAAAVNNVVAVIEGQRKAIRAVVETALEYEAKGGDFLAKNIMGFDKKAPITGAIGSSAGLTVGAVVGIGKAIGHEFDAVVDGVQAVAASAEFVVDAAVAGARWIAPEL